MTYDIRKLVPDLLQDDCPIPANNSQQRKISNAVRERLPEWIMGSVKPHIENAQKNDGITRFYIEKRRIHTYNVSCDKTARVYRNAVCWELVRGLQ